jgi:hypothetical protein
VKFARTHAWPAPADDVLTMLLDPTFREAVCREQQARDYQVSVSSARPPATVKVGLLLSLNRAPTAARKVAGDSVRTEQEERWESTSTAAIRIVIPGRPGALTGGITLTDHGDGTSTQQFDAQVKVDIPLVGGRLEALIGRVLGSGLRREREVGLRWLAGQH